ncbi:MFS transporter [Trueperella sp. LYQ143]|uniref:MFS transporter n=1 Tax=unclassified Trueperella TaxID=2630174 RepID=UPI003983B040
MPSPSSNRNPLIRLILPIYAPALIFAIGNGTIMPVLTLAALSVGFDKSGSSAVMGLLGFAGIAMSPPIGRIIAHIGDRAALICGSVISLASLSGFLWSLHYHSHPATRTVFVVATILLALGANTWSLARQAYVAEAVPVHWRARGLSTLGGMTRIGVLVGPLLATGLLAIWALDSIFIVNIVLVVLAALLVIGYVLPEPTATLHTPSENHTEGEIHRSRLSTAILGVALNCLTVLRANRTVIVPLWGTAQGYEPHFITGTFAVTALVDTIMFVVSGAVMDRRGRHWALIPSFIFMPIGIIVMLCWNTPIGFVVGAAILGFGNGFGAGIVMTVGADLCPPEHRAEFLGLWQAIVAIGAACGPFIISGLTRLFTLSVGLWATVGIGIFGLIWTIVFLESAYRRLGVNLRGQSLD